MCQNFSLTKVTSIGRITKFIANQCGLTDFHQSFLFFYFRVCVHSPWLPWNFIRIRYYEMKGVQLLDIAVTTFNGEGNTIFCVYPVCLILIQTAAVACCHR